MVEKTPESDKFENEKQVTVLVVDDEKRQLETICRGLFLYDYKCKMATGCQDALDLLKGPDGYTIDLMLTDLTMPGKSGMELILQTQALRPDLPIIVITGISMTPDIKTLKEMDLPILQKPFDPNTLDQTIRQLVFEPTRGSLL